MGERVQLQAKTPEATRDNPVFQTRRLRCSQTLHSPLISHILSLQQSIGNQAVQRLIKSGAIQAKLTINQPNDIYEQEADRVTDQVMRMPEPAIQPKPTCPFAHAPSCGEEETAQTKPIAEQIISELNTQRNERPDKEEALQTKAISETMSPLIQRQEDSEQKEETELEPEEGDVESEEGEASLQKKSTNNWTVPEGSTLHKQIHSLKGGGQPLPKNERTFFETRFNTDFSDVRIHDNAKAAQTARGVNAHAFTLGKDVVFGYGKYSPASYAGKKLLAHELTHVVQQAGKNSLKNNGEANDLSAPIKDVDKEDKNIITGTSKIKLNRVDANSENTLFRVAIQLRSTNRVTDTAIRSQDNRREEVLRLLDRLHRLWAISNTNYANQFRYIHALPRGSQVPQTVRGGWTFQPTLDAITRAAHPSLAQAVITNFMRGLSVSGSVGQGSRNNKTDVLSVMDRLNFITPYSVWAAERRVVAAVSTPTVSETAFPRTLNEITKFKLGIASATLGWLPTRASERLDEGDRFAGQTTSHTVTVRANHTASNARRNETRESISVSIFLSSRLPANENRVFLFFSPGDGTEVNPRAPGGNATNVHAMRSGADPTGWILIGIPGFRAPHVRRDRGWNSFDIAAIHSCLARAGRPARIDRLRAAAHSRGGRGLTRTINRGFIPGSNFERVIFLDQPHGALRGLRRGVLVDYTKGGGTGRNRVISALGSRAIGFARLIADRPDVPAPAPARRLLAALGTLPPRGSFTTQPVPAGTTGRINLHSWVRSRWSAVRAIARADNAAQTEWRRFLRNQSVPLNRSIVDQSPWFHVNVEDLMRYFGRRLLDSAGRPVVDNRGRLLGGFGLNIYAHHLFVAEISEELFQ